MLNKEKYADEIFDFAIYGKMFGVNKGKPKSCASMKLCNGCEYKNILGCREKLKEWLNSDYDDTTVDDYWSKVPIDTPILVRDADNESWRKGHFAGISVTGKVGIFYNGGTSWSAAKPSDYTLWSQAMLAEDADYPQVKSKWHNLKDQKPEDKQEVLTWDGIGVEFDRWSDDEDSFEHTDAEEIWWMEFPEPPQKGTSHE